MVCACVTSVPHALSYNFSSLHPFISYFLLPQVVLVLNPDRRHCPDPLRLHQGFDESSSCPGCWTVVQQVSRASRWCFSTVLFNLNIVGWSQEIEVRDIEREERAERRFSSQRRGENSQWYLWSHGVFRLAWEIILAKHHRYNEESSRDKWTTQSNSQTDFCWIETYFPSCTDSQQTWLCWNKLQKNK